MLLGFLVGDECRDEQTLFKIVQVIEGTKQTNKQKT